MLKVMLILYGVRIRLLLVYALSSILELLQNCKFCHLFFVWKIMLGLCVVHMVHQLVYALLYQRPWSLRLQICP